MDGYGIVVTDEASSFFQEIKGQDVKHDSNIGLLNQLFDGERDKSTFTGMRQLFVPPNIHDPWCTASTVLSHYCCYW